MVVIPGPIATTTMRAITHDRFGSAEVLQLVQVPLPVPGEDEVVLRVHAAGVDRGVWHVMTGRPYLGRLVFGLRTPRNPVVGTDVAGTVHAVGAAVTTFATGDEVYGFARGSFADYAIARADKLAVKPANLSFVEAAVLPVSAVTALQALVDATATRPGQSVLVVGASGGVGSYAVQIAKGLGAEVTGVASTAKLDLVRALGADHVLDYTRDDFADGGRRFDVVLDIAGNPSLTRLRRALTPTGTAVITGGEEGGPFSGGMNRQLRAVALSPFLRQHLTTFIARQRGSDLERLTALVEAGTVSPRIDRTFTLEDAGDAVAYLASGQVRGKVAIST
ncbi:MAG: NAD(P)-dependent alcohol dehydrogenase [Marmoricola sp.]|nr:NAD(P)-dependent alcohol dehydrogenase [Marmoricola sp.]